MVSCFNLVWCHHLSTKHHLVSCFHHLSKKRRKRTRRKHTHTHAEREGGQESGALAPKMGTKKRAPHTMRTKNSAKRRSLLRQFRVVSHVTAMANYNVLHTQLRACKLSKGSRESGVWVAASVRKRLKAFACGKKCRAIGMAAKSDFLVSLEATHRPTHPHSQTDVSHLQAWPVQATSPLEALGRVAQVAAHGPELTLCGARNAELVAQLRGAPGKPRSEGS